MAQFAPFAGLRYDTAGIDMNRVISPPYDIVDAEQRRRLAARDPHNAIHVELPVDDPETGADRYRHAAALLGAWRRAGVLTLEGGETSPAPAFYAYRMTFTTGAGTTASTTGVLGALGLEEPGTGDILPHEQTIPKDRSDRLDLLRATGCNISPIWGLSLAGGLSAQLVFDRAPDAEARDDDGVLHELWAVREADRVTKIADCVAAAPVVIADGHHRYEVAWAYREETRAANGANPGGHDAVLAFVIELSADELHVLPIHRLLAGLPEGTDLAAALGAFYEMTPFDGDATVAAAAMAGRGAICIVQPQARHLAVARPALGELAGSDLDSARLAAALGAAFPAPGAPSVSYEPDGNKATAAVGSGAVDAAVLLRPVGVAQIAASAHERRRMPPKSTYFVPKPATGMAYRLVR